MKILDMIGSAFDRFSLGDHPIDGFFRRLALIVLPLAILLTNAILSVAYGYSFFIGQLLILYFLGFISAFASAIYYIQDIYKEEEDYIPFRYFITCFFGLFPPHIHIKNATQESLWQEMVEKIGDPDGNTYCSGKSLFTGKGAFHVSP
jgi:hypothetical protein